MSSQADSTRRGDGLHLPLDDRAGPAPALTEQQAARMVAVVLERAFAPRARGANRRRVWPLLLVAALLLAALSALAGLWLNKMRLKTGRPPTVETSPVVMESPPVACPTGVPLEPAAATASADPNPSVTPTDRSSTPPRSPSSAVVAELPPSEDLLRQANHLRAQKRWADAEQLYRRVVSQYPGTPEAYAAEVAAASLRLEHLGDPGGAREMYESASRLQPEGGLSEETEYGVAEAHRAAGDERAEAAALRSFLARHPDSVLAPGARARLAQLDARKSAGAPSQ